jgi:hypothetical protein
LLRNAFTVVAAWIWISAADCALAAPLPAASIPAANLLQPAELAARLRKDALRPLILQVGFRTLYDRAHIAGADYAGPAREEEGLRRLQQRVASLPRDADIVIYCGCCPWSDCPNIAQAYDTLRKLGFTRVKVLYIADNFGSDWIDKGYPTVQAP